MRFISHFINFLKISSLYKKFMHNIINICIIIIYNFYLEQILIW